MEFPRMVYRAGSMVELESGRYDWRIVADENECVGAQAEGWHLDQYAAKAAAEAPQVAEDAPPDEVADNAPPTREELEHKAQELGIKFDGRWGDKKLAAAIAEKLGA